MAYPSPYRKWHLNRFIRFVGLTVAFYRHTDKQGPRYICSNRPHLALYIAMLYEVSVADVACRHLPCTRGRHQLAIFLLTVAISLAGRDGTGPKGSTLTDPRRDTADGRAARRRQRRPETDAKTGDGRTH